MSPGILAKKPKPPRYYQVIVRLTKPETMKRLLSRSAAIDYFTLVDGGDNPHILYFIPGQVP